MKANVFEGKNRMRIVDKTIPRPGFNEALVRITLTTICGSDLHILRGEYPVKPGLTIGHEPVGIIAELCPGLREYVLVPNARANLATIPETLSDEDVVLLADIASTGISASETANVQLGDTVA